MGFGISPLDVDCVAVLARFEEEPDSGHDLPMTQKRRGWEIEINTYVYAFIFTER